MKPSSNREKHDQTADDAVGDDERPSRAFAVKRGAQMSATVARRRRRGIGVPVFERSELTS